MAADMYYPSYANTIHVPDRDYTRENNTNYPRRVTGRHRSLTIVWCAQRAQNSENGAVTARLWRSRNVAAAGLSRNRTQFPVWTRLAPIFLRFPPHRNQKAAPYYQKSGVRVV